MAVNLGGEICSHADLKRFEMAEALNETEWKKAPDCGVKGCTLFYVQHQHTPTGICTNSGNDDTVE